MLEHSLSPADGLPAGKHPHLSVTQGENQIIPGGYAQGLADWGGQHYPATLSDFYHSSTHLPPRYDYTIVLDPARSVQNGISGHALSSDDPFF